jgi:hypothetical protein
MLPPILPKSNWTKEKKRRRGKNDAKEGPVYALLFCVDADADGFLTGIRLLIVPSIE